MATLDTLWSLKGTQIPFGNDTLKTNGRAEALPLFVFARSACCPIRLRSGQAAKLLGGQFFLFAFHAHLFELALFGFDGCGDFLLNLSLPKDSDVVELELAI